MLEFLKALVSPENVGTAVSLVLALVLYEGVKVGRDAMRSRMGVPPPTGSPDDNGWRNKYEEARFTALREAIENGFSRVVSELKSQRIVLELTMKQMQSDHDRTHQQTVEAVTKLLERARS